MKTLWITATATALMMSGTLHAQETGDAAKGESAFKSCKACHTIANGTEVILKGGKAGPNLFGIIGRAAGSADYKYSKSMIAAGEGGLIWDQETLVAFITNPSAYLKEVTGDSAAKSKMSVKVKKNAADLAAFLATVSPAEASATDG